VVVLVVVVVLFAIDGIGFGLRLWSRWGGRRVFRRGFRPPATGTTFDWWRAVEAVVVVAVLLCNLIRGIDRLPFLSRMMLDISGT
jgi:hypothetical protein